MIEIASHDTKIEMKSSTKTKIARLWNLPSEIGDRYGINWLTYNPGVFFEFAMVARRNSPLVAESLAKVFPEAKSYNDIGSGTGQFVRALRLRGHHAEGFEYSLTARVYSRLIGVPARKFDLALLEPCGKITRADVAYSLEVGEHVPEFMSVRLVKVLVDAGGIVVFSAGQPGQKGHGHINNKPKQYWADIFERHSYFKWRAREDLLVADLRAKPRLSSFLYENVQVFAPRDFV